MPCRTPHPGPGLPWWLPAIAAALLALPASPAWAGPAPAPAPSAGPVLRPAELASDEYAETFTFVADLDDGTYVQLQLAVTNLGPGSGTGLCRALVKRPDAGAWTSHRRHGRSGWSHAAGASGEALTVGDCSARSGDRTTVRVALGGRSVELTFPEPLSERAPPTTIRARGQAYRSSVLQAFTPVSARLVGFGADAAGPLQGGGYADHSLSTVAPDALAQRWVRVRALRPPGGLLIVGRQLPDGTWDPAWIWRQGGAPHPLDAIELHHQSGPDGAWTVALRDGPMAATVSSGPRLYRYAPLDELGPLGWVVGALMDVPVTSTFRAALSERGPLDGILEVSLLGEE